MGLRKSLINITQHKIHTVATSVKAILRYCCRAFGCDSNLHYNILFNYTSKFYFFDMSVIPSLKLSLEHNVVPHSGEEHVFDTITKKCDTYIWVVLKKR
jgi:hypothetical protein